MTPQELRDRRCRILMDLTDKGDEYDDDLFVTLNQLEELDAAYTASQQNPYYAFITQAEALFALLKTFEGRPEGLHGAIDALTSHLMRYKASLPHGDDE